MSAPTITRRWTAVIRDRDTGVEVDATPSHNDLKVDQRKQAMRDARDLGIEAGDVILYKTTKAHGTVRDRAYWFHTNDQGEMFYV